ncbi:MAG: ATP synthase F1 subunit epsilon [Patescibacteria group bacterium]
MSLLLEIITPEKIVFRDEIDEAIAPTVNGEITILPHHIGLITQVVPGELIIKKNNKNQSIAVTEGFLEVSDNRISILANYAINAENINVAKAEEAKKRAEHLMQEKTTDRDFRIAEGELRKAILELKIANKHRKRITL